MVIAEPRDAKRAMRSLMRSRRMAASSEHPLLLDQVGRLVLPPASTVAGVWPLPGEPDLVPAWDALHRGGHHVVLPETMPAGQALRFRAWQPDAVLRPGRFGTLHPDGPVLQPDIVFVPLLAWDRHLHRLGYGGGYYDRTLAALPRAVAIGYGFTHQQVAAIPVGPHDVPLDALVTERGLLTREGLEFEDIVSGRHRRPQRP